MEFFVFLLLMVTAYLPFLKLKGEWRKPIKIIIMPWLVYTSIIIFFGVRFSKSSLEPILIISILIFLSGCFFTIGRAYGKKTMGSFYRNSTLGPFSSKGSRSVYKCLLVLGLLGGAYFILEKIQTLSGISSFYTFDLHQVRISNSVESELGDKGAATFLSRFFFSFCFLSFCFSGEDFRHRDRYLYILNICCITTVFCVAMISAGRLFIFYYIAGFFLMKYINGGVIKRWQYSFASLAIVAMIAMFYFRAPSNVYGVKEFYMNLLKIEDIGFFFGLADFEGGLFDTVSILVMYLVHSFGVLSEFYTYLSFNEYAYGGYSFNLPYRILNKIFSLEIPVVQDYRNDPSLGLYASFARDILADFGVVGACIFLSSIALVTGYSYSLRNYSWSYRVVTYWGMVYFAMAPLLSVISVGFINVMYFFSIFFVVLLPFFSKVTRKFKVKTH